MSKIYLTLALALLVCEQSIGKQEDVVEWKDFIDGMVPAGAVPAGGTNEGPKIYVGLARVINGSNEALIPTSIQQGVPSVNVTLDEENIIEVKDNIKILCRKENNLTTLSWAFTRNVNFLDLFESDQFYPVRAGWQVGEYDSIEYNSSLYIGRGISGQYWIGKVYLSNADKSKNFISWSPYWYNKIANFVEYSVLVYDFY